MKKSLVWLVGLIIVGIMPTLSMFGEEMTPPTTISSESTISTGNSPEPRMRLLSLRDIEKMSQVSAGIGTTSITPIIGVSLNSPSFGYLAAKLISDARLGKMNNTVHKITDPTDYSVCLGKIEWFNLVLSKNIKMYAGKLSPTGLFKDEYGQVVLQLVQAESKAKIDNISLSMVVVGCGSSEAGNILGDSLTFRDADEYGVYAIGIKADGRIITSGPSTEKVARVIFITRMKIFDGGDTQEGLDQVEAYVISRNLAVTYYARILGDPDSKSTAVVSLTGNSNKPAVMGIDRTSVTFVGDERTTYLIQSATSLSGPWTTIGTFVGKGSLALKFAAEGKSFYRAIVP